MYPELLRIGSIPINSYGLMLAVSFLLGMKLAAVRAQKLGINPGQISNLSVSLMVAAIIGSRLFYVATHVDEFSGDWLSAISFWKGLYGLSMLGGVILAVITGFVYIFRKRWPAWKLADAVIPSFALGIFITRIGCFLNGCCFGSETCSSIGVTFPEGSLPWNVFGSAFIHPTQLYSSLSGLYILAVLLFADRRKHFPGFIFCLFTVLYGVTRFGIEEYRYFDHDPNLMFGFSQFANRPGITDNQLISLFMIAAAIGIAVWLYAKHSRTSADSS